MPTTNKPTVFDGNQHREMTDAEYAQYQLDVEAAQAAQVLAEAKAAARQSALAKLAQFGLTEIEIDALVGV